MKDSESDDTPPFQPKRRGSREDKVSEHVESGASQSKQSGNHNEKAPHALLAYLDEKYGVTDGEDRFSSGVGVSHSEGRRRRHSNRNTCNTGSRTTHYLTILAHDLIANSSSSSSNIGSRQNCSSKCNSNGIQRRRSRARKSTSCTETDRLIRRCHSCSSFDYMLPTIGEFHQTKHNLYPGEEEEEDNSPFSVRSLSPHSKSANSCRGTQVACRS